MEENHMGWKLFKGVRQDLVNLFQLFATTGSVRYEDFCSVWKKTNFSLIFSGRISFIELLEFTEELLQITKEYLLSIYEFHTRVAALYALYGLYFKQPIREAAKIRFTKSEWQEVQSLVGKCKAEKHYDVAFIHYKMYLNGAYSFTATVRAAGLEKGFRKYSEKKYIFIPKNYKMDLLYRPLISENLVNSLVKLESLYCKKKSELLGEKNLVFIDGKFATSLQEELKKYASSRQNLMEEEEGAGSEGEQSNSEQAESEEENEGVVRKRLKAKSYSFGESEVSEAAAAEGNEEPQSRETKSWIKHAELMAKKKAHYYMKKLKEREEGESSSQGAGSGVFNLEPLIFP